MINKHFQKNSYCRPISTNFIFLREALKDLLLAETIPTIPSKCKIVKILIFRSLFRENLLWKCSRERERNISILTILHLSFYFPVWHFLDYYLQLSYYPDIIFLNTWQIFFKHQHSGRAPATLRNNFLWLQLNDYTSLGIVSVKSKSVKYFNF